MNYLDIIQGQYDTIKMIISTFNVHEREAVVFDIDETLVRNYDEGGVMLQVPVLFPGALDLVSYVQGRGYRVIFVTGRRSAVYGETERVLKPMMRQLAVPVELYMVKDEYNKAAHTAKASIRKHISTTSGLQIVMCIGDQVSDLTGGD